MSHRVKIVVQDPAAVPKDLPFAHEVVAVSDDEWDKPLPPGTYVAALRKLDEAMRTKPAQESIAVRLHDKRDLTDASVLRAVDHAHAQGRRFSIVLRDDG